MTLKFLKSFASSCLRAPLPAQGLQATQEVLTSTCPGGRVQQHSRQEPKVQLDTHHAHVVFVPACVSGCCVLECRAGCPLSSAFAAPAPQ